GRGADAPAARRRARHLASSGPAPAGVGRHARDSRHRRDRRVPSPRQPGRPRAAGRRAVLNPALPYPMPADVVPSTEETTMEATETVFDAARRLERNGTPYALVSVIRALAPASARPGDKAIVTADGTMHGWVGGGCAQPVVVRAVRQV